jgi:hypothetical protein
MKVKIKKAAVTNESAEMLNELDFVAGFKNFLKSPVATSKNIAKGIAQIGITGKETTILGGEEVFDIEKRNSLRKNAEAELNDVLQKLDDTAKTNAFTRLKSELENVSFPNQPNEESFNSYVSKLKGMYDGTVRTYEDGELTPELANAVIAVLRDIVIYYQDFKIADKYIYLNEAEEGAVSKSYASAYSKKLPLGLAAAGLALGGLGIAADSDIFRNTLSKLKDADTVDVNRIKEAIKGTLQIKPGEGPTQLATRVLGLPKDFLGANAPAEHLADPRVQKFFTEMLPQVLRNPELGGGDLLNQVTNDPSSHGKTVAQVFAKLAKGTETAKLDPTTVGAKKLMIDPGKFDVVVGEKVTEVAKNTSADTLKNKFLNFLGNKAAAILQGLGIALVVGAGVSAGMRFKGKRSSRMATLKALVDSFKDVVAGQKQLATGEEQPKLAGRGEAPQLPAAATKAQAQLPGKEQLPALKGKEAQPALPTQPKLALPPGEEPGEKQGPERVIPVGPSSIEGKSIDSLMSDLQKKLDNNEQLKKLSSERGDEGKKLEKAISAMVKIAINDITKQLNDAGYEAGDEVTIAEGKSIKLSFFDKFASELTSKPKKVSGGSAGMQTILAVVRDWAQGVGFTVDVASLEKFGKKGGFSAKTEKPSEQPAAAKPEEAPKSEKPKVDPENVAVSKTPVDAGQARKTFNSAKKAAGGKITVKTSKSPKAVVATTKPPLSPTDKKAVKAAAKDVKAPASKISSTEPSAVVVPAAPADASKLKEPEKAAAVVNKLEKSKQGDVESKKADINSMSAVNQLQDLVNQYEEENDISEEQSDMIVRRFRAMKTKNLENITDMIDDIVRNKSVKSAMKDEIRTWFNSLQESKLNESYDFRNRFMKLAGILRG